MPSATEFQGHRIFVNAPQYEWRPEVHVQGLDEESRQWIVAIEGFLHLFGVRTKRQEQELHQRLVDSQAMHADLVKNVHELRQFTIVKLASYMTRLDSLDHELWNYALELHRPLLIWRH